MNFWCVFTVSPNKESDAQADVRAAGFTACVPVKQCIRHQRGRKYFVTRPALPGYVFVEMEKYPSNAALRTVIDTEHVRGVVGFNGQPGRITEDVMAEFIKRLADDEPVTSEAQLQPGAYVRMRTGRFAELNGVVVHVGKAEARVLVELFGRSCETKVPLMQLEELNVGGIETSSRERRRLHGNGKSGSLIRG